MTPLLALLLVQSGKAPTATIKLAAPTATVGKEIKGTIKLVFPEGLHGYQNPPADEFENPIKVAVVEKTYKLVKVNYPVGTEFKITGAEKASMIYEGEIEIPFTLLATKPAAKNAKDVSFKIDYQLCSASNCWPPASLNIKVPLKVVAAPKKA